MFDDSEYYDRINHDEGLLDARNVEGCDDNCRNGVRACYTHSQGDAERALRYRQDPDRERFYL